MNTVNVANLMEQLAQQEERLRRIRVLAREMIAAGYKALARDRNEAIGAILLVALLLSGCSVLNNSERYYKNRPYQPINYRTYQTD